MISFSYHHPPDLSGDSIPGSYDACQGLTENSNINTNQCVFNQDLVLIWSGSELS